MARMNFSTARVIAALAVVVVLVGIVVTLRCTSPGMPSCSIDTLFGNDPKLDVPYAATHPDTVQLMLEMGQVKPGDYVIDLGTGDGRILIAAARDRGARGLGVDIDPVMIRRAQAAARRAGVADRVEFKVLDLFQTPLHDADVVMMYLLPDINLELRPRLLAELKPGSRVVSHEWGMGNWKPDDTRRAGGANVHRWTIPDRASMDGATAPPPPRPAAP